MDLQLLQTSLCSLIKSKPGAALLQDEYLQRVADSHHLVLVRKIALWWRKIQVEGYCHLTTRLLQSNDELDGCLAAFFSEENYSPFRDEVGRQFLAYLAQKSKDQLTQLVAAFELALIRIKTGEHLAYAAEWPYEPYAVINGLLAGKLSANHLQPGQYRVEVSSLLQEELFRVTDISYCPPAFS